MQVADYYFKVLVPANGAIGAMRRAGIPIDVDRIHAQAKQWEAELAVLEKRVESAIAEKGFVFKYSDAHTLSNRDLARYLYSAQGLGLTIYAYTDTGFPSTDDEALKPYASLSLPSPDDIPVVKDILKVRSLAKGLGTYLRSFAATRRADGCCHPQFNWARVRTARLSAENPPVHQIPERADPEIAIGIRSCIVPRQGFIPYPDEWDPRKHGSCWRWDVAGTEAILRAAMLVHRFCHKPGILWEYLRKGKDVHALTAALLHDVPEGTFKKGDPERDKEGKHTFFGLLYGGTWRTVQNTFWRKARIWYEDVEVQQKVERFSRGYPELTELYNIDLELWAKRGFCEDGFGRRRQLPFPDNAMYNGYKWILSGSDAQQKTARKALSHCFHMAANSPTQSMGATCTLWMIALAYFGEYVPLRVPSMWEESGGVLFPEAASWRFHEGPGPGGKPFQAWQFNTVHDSCWGDCGPGMLESVMKVVARRCTALPFDWMLEADCPFRIDLQCGPDMGHLYDYNDVAEKFGLEKMPKR